MSEPSNDLIYQTLLKQNEQLGRIEANQLTTKEAMEAHFVEDKAAHARIAKLEAAHNKMRGAAAVWSLIISAVVSALGWYYGKN